MHVLRLLIPEFGLEEDWHDHTTEKEADTPEKPTASQSTATTRATTLSGLSGLRTSFVLHATAKALAHTNEKVRKLAMDVALCTQRLIGKTRILRYLKEARVKPAILNELEKTFVEIGSLAQENHTIGKRDSNLHHHHDNDNDPSKPSHPRPATVFSPLSSSLDLSASRRLLMSAPIASGGSGKKSQDNPSLSSSSSCTSDDAMKWTPRTIDTFVATSESAKDTIRTNRTISSTLSNEEESFMNALISDMSPRG
jgi:hypothetical protein